jgi:alkyl hydroperoxide reductase subunit AhpF
MPIISAEDQATIRDIFDDRLVDTVTLVLFTTGGSDLTVPGRPECVTCEDTQTLLEELVGLSDKLELHVHDFYAEADAAEAAGISELPSLILKGKNQGTLRFVGAPAGYEFSSLIEDLIDLSRGETALSEKAREVLSKLSEPVHFQVFVTPT